MDASPPRPKESIQTRSSSNPSTLSDLIGGFPPSLEAWREEHRRRKLDEMAADALAHKEEIRQRCGSLHEFVKAAWPILEPEAQFSDNWHVQLICSHLEAVTRGEITRLLINVWPGSMKSLIVSVLWPAWEWGPAGRPTFRYVSTSFNDKPVNRDTTKTRDLILSEWYQTLWPEVHLKKKGETSFSNTQTGSRIGVAFGSLTSQRGDRLIIDDPHSTETAESDVERAKTTRRFLEGAQNRLNDQKHSAIVVIMQRLHQNDVSGTIKKHPKLGYVHVELPMEFEPDRAYRSKWGSDPRTVTGELADPERFPRSEIEKLKESGDYFWCTPCESPVLLPDLSMKPIGLIQEGDMVLGWNDDPQIDDGRRHALRSLIPVEVKAISRSTRPVVKITLDSGEVIRCTADHKWFTGRGRGGHKLYLPAKAGRALLRVCPSYIEPPSDEDLRDLGWLAGFFDADGSVSIVGPDRKRPSSLIQFTQGAGRNLPMCEKLERLLTRLGFDFGYRERKGNGRGANHTVRQYYLRGRTLPTLQRFLHLVQPTKWRERIIAGAQTAKFISGRERVVSIEADGEEEVFGLTTTTGNYVVWGLASSNSGQYQQRPAPREGGMFKVPEDWETSRVVDVVPGGGREVGGWDFAGSKRKTSPYTVRVKMKRVPTKGIYIRHVDRRRTLPHELDAMIETVCADDGHGCYQSLPQDPGQAGKSQKWRIGEQLDGFDFRVTPETGDKETRAEPFAAQWNLGRVFLERGDWNDTFIDELRNFPASSYKDQVDASSRAYAELVRIKEEEGDGVAGPLIPVAVNE